MFARNDVEARRRVLDEVDAARRRATAPRVPSAPEPAKRSSTRASGSHGLTMLIHASRTRSAVGRTRRRRGGASIGGRATVPRRCARRLAVQVGEPRLQARHAVLLVALEAIGDVERRRHVELAARAEPFPSRAPRARPLSVCSAKLETVRRRSTRGGAARRTPRVTSSGDGLRHAARLEVAQQRLELERRLRDRDLEIDAQLGNEIVLGELRERDLVEAIARTPECCRARW